MSEVTEWIKTLEAMTGDEIADLLRTEKVSGRFASVGRCPVAEFLRTKGAVAEIAVYGGMIEWTELVVGPDGNPRIDHGHALTPHGICEFVYRFDAGMYPDLKAEPKSLPELNIGEMLKALYSDPTKSVKELLAVATNA